ncbi:cytochrome P450 2K1-like isoform X2 [Conger conger]|uniref:cytochrome P450 2K1-like isoform X2 n=1 Tax=Conger conger TaxID=82655 RepID=UPI002A5997B2|nr:cytochrome P450 2K1-like isoform X2 [Conger conger]
MAVVAGLLLQPSFTEVLLGAVLVLFLHYVITSTLRFRREPPGPRPLPIIGNLLQLDLNRPYHSLYELSKTYGSVFKVHFGCKKVIVLAGYKTVKEALVNHATEFGDRDLSPVVRDLYNGHGEPFDPKLPLDYSVANITSSIVYGSRFDYSDPQLWEMATIHPTYAKIWYPIIQLYDAFPWLARRLKSWGAVVDFVEKKKARVRRLVRVLQDSHCAQERRGFVDSFLTRQQEESERQNSFFNEENLVTCVLNLFSASDTTSTVLQWALVIMAKYPHIQERVQEELGQVIGSQRPEAKDRKALPYTNAVIHEVQRVANIDPLSVPHAASCDVTFKGFFISKGTRVIPLLMSVLCDESQWESPHSFKPDHFLDDQGHFVRKDAFLSFSAGRRVCLAESLARTELFLIFTSLLQKFSFSPPPGVSESELDLTPVGSNMLSPTPYELCAVSRF